MNLREFYIRVCKLIEEYDNDNVITEDEDVRDKMPVITQQGINQILQVKPIMRFETLLGEEAEERANHLLYRLPDDLYKLRVVHYASEYRQVGQGIVDVIAVPYAGGVRQDIDIEYEAFHAKIDTSIPFNSSDNDNFIIELTEDCLGILENYVAMGLTTDDSEMYGHFFSQYQSGMANLTAGRQRSLISFDGI